MDGPLTQSQLEALERRAERMERRVRVVTCGCVLTLLMVLLIAWIPGAQAEVRQAERQADVLRVRQLVVVDEQGSERVVISARLPDPQIQGKRIGRRSRAAGIQLNDASGNERGGFGMLDDGSIVLGLDDELSRERAHLYFIPNRGVGLLIQGGERAGQIALVVPSQGAQAGVPKFEIVDHAGKVIVALPASK